MKSSKRSNKSNQCRVLLKLRLYRLATHLVRREEGQITGTPKIQRYLRRSRELRKLWKTETSLKLIIRKVRNSSFKIVNLKIKRLFFTRKISKNHLRCKLNLTKHIRKSPLLRETRKTPNTLKRRKTCLSKRSKKKNGLVILLTLQDFKAKA